MVFYDGMSLIKKSGLNMIAVLHPQQKEHKANQTQRDHGPARQPQGGAAKGAGKEQPPGAGEQQDDHKAAQGEGGHSRKDTQDVIWEKGEQKGQT